MNQAWHGLRALALAGAVTAALASGRAEAAAPDLLRQGLDAAATTAGRAEAAAPDLLQKGLDAARGAEQTLIEQARQAIVVGGVLLYRHRHAVAGAAMGCVAGSMTATTLSLGAGLASGGAALAGTAPAAALGCGLGALGGAALGQPLDDVYAEP
jgi:hypothetical protein